MRDDAPSGTAAWVAAMRGLASCLPDPLCVARDPFGLRFGGAARVFERRERLVRATWRVWMRGALASNVHLLQLRTRAIDDVVRDFARTGRQIVIMGAGFDARAWRLEELRGVTVYEIDHPATQRRKRALLAGVHAPHATVRFVAWNFESEDVRDLPARLRELGHDATAPSLAILEGVLPYLTEDAIDRTFAAARALGPAGSPFVFTYLERALVDVAHTERALVSLLGEPYKHGFVPRDLPQFLAARGFRLEDDVAMVDLARSVLPKSEVARLRRAGRHVALAIRC